MTERKFTPPTSFPAQYRNGEGEIITIVGQGVGEFPYSGQSNSGVWALYNSSGKMRSGYDCDRLHDISKAQVRWANDYQYLPGSEWYESRYKADRFCTDVRISVIRREWTEGEAPKYFTEEVTND